MEIPPEEEGGNVTVVETEGRGTGWQFDAADAGGLMFGLWNAMNTYKNHKVGLRAAFMPPVPLPRAVPTTVDPTVSPPPRRHGPRS